MKPEEKGKFCGSCQKTVIDFTSMSDRQIAEFFKKPVGSTCGRFHNDQLDRPIEIPKKRIPWVKYFFTIALPAFLASCKFAGREETVGKMLTTEVVKKPLVGDTTVVSDLRPTLGMISLPIDSIPAKKQTNLIDETLKPKHLNEEPMATTMGKMLPTEVEMANDTAIKDVRLLDTLNITGLDNCERKIFMGGLVASPVVVKSENFLLTETPQQKIEVLAYPNPIKAGGQLTVLVNKKDDAIKQVQLFSSSGAVIPVQRNGSTNDERLVLTLPASVAAGTYFLHIVSEKAQASAVKIVVLN